MKTLWPSPDSLDCSPHQREQIGKAFSGRLSILTGGPGTGKSHTFGRVVRSIADRYGTYEIGCASPFSKAAQVMSEFLDGQKIPVRATTIHRLLGVQKAGYDGKGWRFIHGPTSPLPYKFLFLDEFGTCDTDLCAALFSAIAPGTHVLCLGDRDQLPPVGSGAPFRDFIAAGLPTGKLSECWRNAGIGAKCCQEIAAGRAFIYSQRPCEATGDNLIHRESHSPALTIQILKRYLEGAAEAGVDPIWDCQTLVAVNEKSELGRKNLNSILQELLNPRGATAKGCPFRVGDKVICTRPQFFEVVDTDAPDPEVEAALRRQLGSPPRPNVNGRDKQERQEDLVANGEMGRVRSINAEKKFILIDLPCPKRTVRVPLGKPRKSDDGLEESGGTGCDWELGYACTYHKSQGSQWPFVFCIIDDSGGASMVASRELIYTGISRFRRFCFTLGREQTVNRWCRKQVLSLRKTFLKELLTDQLA